MLIINARIFDGENFIEDNCIEVLDSKIVKTCKTEDICLKCHNDIYDAKNMIVSPGFIDLQLNGCGGVLFNDKIEKETLEIMNETNMKYGCTSFLPTLITSPDEKILKSLEFIKKLENKEEIGVLGLHIEGPYISVEKKGIHRPDYIRVLDDKIVDEIAKAGYENVKIMTIAPEKAKIEHLEKLKNSKIILSMGHTYATYNECLEKEKYFEMATHFFNAMREFGSREPGVIGYLMDRKVQNCGVIVDGMHADFASVRVAKELLKEKMFLVTDAVSPMGTDMKEFYFEGNLVYHIDGKCISPQGSLGGSALDMITGVKNLVNEVNITLDEALRMATSYPAKAIKVEDRYGYIKPGYIANLAVFDENYKVVSCMQYGKLKKYN